LAQQIVAEGPMHEARVARIAGQILLALGAAHRANVIHRDLKPENVFLCPRPGAEETVKLLDFGMAKVLEAQKEPKLTLTGSVVGTPAYMAPETARGGSADARTDIYAVGSVMYEALTGSPPFQADNYNALIFMIQESQPVALEERRPDLDPELGNVVATAMAKHPAVRFQSTEEMARALLPWLTAG
jgi:serine/threonine-protein kinase